MLYSGAMPLHTKLKAARLRRGLTQSQVAGAVGVRDKTISGYERGLYGPARNRIPIYAKTLDLPVEEFFESDAPAEKMAREIVEIMRQIPREQRLLVKDMLKRLLPDE
jgi:transcriptional regulator with XRE-family HTH domain